MTLEQSHDNRSGNVIGKVRHYFNGISLILLPHKAFYIHFQDILVNNLHIVIRTKRILQNRN